MKGSSSVRDQPAGPEARPALIFAPSRRSSRSRPRRRSRRWAARQARSAGRGWSEAEAPALVRGRGRPTGGRGRSTDRSTEKVTMETKTEPTTRARSPSKPPSHVDRDGSARPARSSSRRRASRLTGATAASLRSGRRLEIYRNQITAFIGPSGCGKSTYIRCLNRMNDLVPGARDLRGVSVHGVRPLRPRPSTRSRCAG